ncbi:UNVERIFIED_CONTAM: hypothetical protein GTU68_048404 [Idotea baltica]|nr:hypothetical protein [Idotea baltica]
MNQGAHIVISTPGRLQDLLARKGDDGPALSAGLKSLEVLILDEADRLLDCGFSATINTILAYLPKLRRTGIFSATQTDDVTNLIRAGMRNPVQVRVKEKASHNFRTPLSLQNFYMNMEADVKIGVLVKLLKERENEKTMVFFLTCACVEYFFDVLQKALPKSTNLLSLHGKMKQRRFQIFDQFRKLKSGIVLCTDVLCRGVDIPEVDWVVQYDPPSSAESFVHRCGRTARNGKEGSALLMLLPNEAEYVHFIELNQKVNLLQIPTPDPPNLLDMLRDIQIEDRAVMDRANRAYVSHIQAYTKHECSLLINLKKLNFGKLAMGFGLLKLPRMPELKKYENVDFIPCDMDFNSIKYKDGVKEKAREEAWSQQKDKLQKKKARKEKKMIKIDNNKFSEEDLKDLDEDFRMIKRFKKGKVSEDHLSKYFECEEEEKPMLETSKETVS